MYILWTLDTSGALRFGELRRKVDGISTKVLTERLRMLKAIDIVHRDYEPTIPPQVTSRTQRRDLKRSVCNGIVLLRVGIIVTAYLHPLK